MDRVRKKEMIERAAERFVLLQEADKAYIAGYMTGLQEERAKWVKARDQETDGKTIREGSL